ncbi:MAG: SpoIID/LytB domain-containing protein [Candidatus Melainabacteria bacterium]|jgi:stage II sporulation protein D
MNIQLKNLFSNYSKKNTHIIQVVILCSILFFSYQPSKAKTNQTVHVKLFHAYPNISQVIIENANVIYPQFNGYISPEEITIRCKNHHLNISQNKKLITSFNTQSGKLVLNSSTSKGISIKANIQNTQTNFRTYTGKISIYSDKNCNIHLENEVLIDDYVAVVVGSETPKDWPAEPLKAQAILTQTRLASMKPNQALVDSTQDEAYLGMEYVSTQVRQAAQSVKGQILTYESKPIHAYYHSTCAGKTSSENYFAGDNFQKQPYLKPVNCSYCSISPFWKIHSSVISAEQLQRIFKTLSIEVIETDIAGRPIQIKLGDNSNNTKIISGYQFWLSIGQNLGWGKIPGTLYSIKKLDSGSILIESKGAGHGVGLCQWGAAEQARLGKTYEQILNYYFPGTKVSIQK